uniref:Uncharacterized protein n=1 Tax=Rhizophora mucronata TaxID=61149 RepID=A0A2P2PYJ3_RHIMU
MRQKIINERSNLDQPNTNTNPKTKEYRGASLR